MFGKKKAQPPPLPPFPLQVLTEEYLIEGTVASETEFVYHTRGIVLPIPLTSVQIRGTGPLDVPPRTYAQFSVMAHTAVAMIPRVDYTLTKEYEIWKLCTYPMQGVFHFGPYVIQGKLMLPGKDFFRMFLPMLDVCINSQYPGARMGELRAPFAVVYFDWLLGYEVN